MPMTERITITERCACGAHLSLFESHGDWFVTCAERCYDSEGDEPIESLIGNGATPADALRSYHERREALDLDPVYVPSELATFIVPSHPGSFDVVGFRTRSLAEAHMHADAFRDADRRIIPPSPIYFCPNATPLQKAANQ